MRPHRAFLIAAFLIAALAAAWFARPQAPAPEWRDGSVSELRSSMEALIRAYGGDGAYASFGVRYAQKDFDTSHNAAHLFGESLYEELGTSGVAVCDAGFNFGCYHGFFAAAVSAEGLEVVGALDAACGSPDAPGSSACQHGIGHGILEHLGHDNLVAALEACGLTNQPDPLAGCTGGVFMEYNVPLVADPDGSYEIAMRPFDEAASPYAPCDELPERFRPSCYQELPQWWHQALAGDFARMASYCAAVDVPRLAETCVMGIAKIIPSSSDYSVERAARFCGFLPASRRDLCITNASWAFETNTGSHQEALALCAHASEAARANCPS